MVIKIFNAEHKFRKGIESGVYFNFRIAVQHGFQVAYFAFAQCHSYFESSG
jgi:hypothetical protein